MPPSFPFSAALLIIIAVFLTTGCTQKPESPDKTSEALATVDPAPAALDSETVLKPEQIIDIDARDSDTAVVNETEPDSAQNEDKAPDNSQHRERFLPNLQNRFHSCDDLKSRSQSEIEKYSLDRFTERNELIVNGRYRYLLWTDIESNFTASTIEVPAGKNALAELENIIRMKCADTLPVPAENGVAAQLYFCTSPKTAQELDEDKIYDSLDIYLGLQSPKDNTQKIYSLRADAFSESCDSRTSGHQDCSGANLLSIASRSFLDTTAVYVRLVTSYNYQYEHCCYNGTNGFGYHYITWVFAGDNLKKLGFWTDTTAQFSTSWEEAKDESYAEKCSFSYTEMKASFKGQIHPFSSLKWEAEADLDSEDSSDDDEL